MSRETLSFVNNNGKNFLKIENVREKTEEIHIISVKWSKGHPLRSRKQWGGWVRLQCLEHGCCPISMCRMNAELEFVFNEINTVGQLLGSKP